MLRAKPDVSLRAHTEHVLDAAAVFGRAYGVPTRHLLLGALFHDAGKGHPYFQRVLSGQPNFDYPHRHEISSLLFLPLVPSSRWPGVIEAVLAHHKSTRGDPAERGLLDLDRTYPPDLLFRIHADDLDGGGPSWDRWHRTVVDDVLLPLADRYALHFSARRVCRADARAALDYVRSYAAEAPRRPSLLSGALMESDHFASAFRYRTRRELGALFTTADLSPFATEHPLYPLSRRAVDRSTHTMVIAPTGAGKTHTLLQACSGRTFYVLPFQASINAMARRLRAATGADVRRLHAASTTALGPDERAPLQRFGGAAIKVMTPHQLASIVFGLRGYEKQLLDLRGQDVILDEVHVYDRHAQAMVLALVDELARLGCRVHVGTATIPSALQHALIDRLGDVQTIRLTDNELALYDRHVVHKRSDWRAPLDRALRNGERVLMVCNRVQTAQSRYRELQARYRSLDDRLLLIHSRYRRGDRAALETAVEALADGPGPAVAVATQVVEVSLDVSYDMMVTDAAPFDSLVQRFGRVNRHVTRERRLADVHVLSPPATEGAALPYDLATIRASYAALPDGDVLRAAATQSLIDRVYPTIDLADISVERARRPDGTWRLPALVSRPRTRLLETLAIESATVVRATDAEAYPDPDLDIPVPASMARALETGGYAQADSGTRPYIIPDTWYDFGSARGLGLTGHP